MRRLAPIPLLFALACAPAAECGEALDLDQEGFFYGDAVPRIALEVDDQALAALPTLPREIGPDVPATFVVNGEASTVGLDLKGNTSFRTVDGKASFKIDMAEFIDGATFHGVRRVTLNSLVDDRSRLAGAVAYALFGRLGLPAPRQGYACVSLNGEELGLYGVVETLDEAFVARSFDDPSGYLYDRAGEADFTVEALRFFETEVEGVGEPRAELRALVEAVDTAPELLPVLESHFSADAFFGFLAAELVLASVDGYARNANNFLVYHEPGVDRFWLVPWGVDQALAEPAGALVWPGEEGGRLGQRCLAEPSCRARLEARVAGLAAELPGLEAEARELGARIAALPDPRAEESELERWSAREAAYGFLAGRAGALGGG